MPSFAPGTSSSSGGTTTAAKGSKTFSAASFDATTPEQIVAANAARISVTIANYSGGTVWLGKDNTVSAATGIPLTDGASLSDDSSDDAWWAVADAGVTGDVRIVEVA